MTTLELRGLRVLIVEDHRDSADMLREALGLCGADTRAEYRADAALEVFRTYRPHVVIADVHLRGQYDGLWLVRQIRAEPSCQGTTPVIAVTGERFLSPDQMQPFSGVIVKPVDTDRLPNLLLKYAEGIDLD